MVWKRGCWQGGQAGRASRGRPSVRDCSLTSGEVSLAHHICALSSCYTQSPPTGLSPQAEQRCPLPRVLAAWKQCRGPATRGHGETDACSHQHPLGPASRLGGGAGHGPHTAGSHVSLQLVHLQAGLSVGYASSSGRPTAAHASCMRTKASPRPGEGGPRRRQTCSPA